MYVYQHCHELGGGCFGRNMDVEYSFGEQVAVTPRRYSLQFGGSRRRRSTLP